MNETIKNVFDNLTKYVSIWIGISLGIFIGLFLIFYFADIARGDLESRYLSSNVEIFLQQWKWVVPFILFSGLISTVIADLIIRSKKTRKMDLKGKMHLR